MDVIVERPFHRIHPNSIRVSPFFLYVMQLRIENVLAHTMRTELESFLESFETVVCKS